jgi:hypothetical protein
LGLERKAPPPYISVGGEGMRGGGCEWTRGFLFQGRSLVRSLKQWRLGLESIVNCAWQWRQKIWILPGTICLWLYKKTSMIARCLYVLSRCCGRTTRRARWRW